MHVTDWSLRDKYSISREERRRIRREKVLRLLQEGKAISSYSLAEQIGANRLTIWHDLNALKKAGHPIIGVKGRKNGGYSIAPVNC